VNPELQPAAPDMAPVASALIYLTMGKMADYLFGAQDVQQILSRLFQAKSNRFSYQFVEVVRSSGKVAGLAITYSGRKMRSLEPPTALHLLRVTGVSGFIRFIRRARPLLSFKEAELDEYFISNIAVVPEQQGQGLGKFMLHEIEKEARAQGYTKISLTVDMENKRAFSLYNRTGFQVVETVTIEKLRSRIGYDGFYRMLKTLG
jgi:ribosomal protein S18 acetylase RimI-like enzyme